jgi:hypothetical protein
MKRIRKNIATTILYIPNEIKENFWRKERNNLIVSMETMKETMKPTSRMV